MLPKLHINIERWKYNKTFEVYVSNMGHVRNKSKADIAPLISRKGYLSVFVDGSKPGFIQLHRLVMLTWRPTPEAETLTVDHLDHNKRNNALSNLEWVTEEENLRRADCDLLPDPSDKSQFIRGVRCMDCNGKILDIIEKEDKLKVASELHKCSGFKYETFCNYVSNVSKGITIKKEYCGITIVPIYMKEGTKND